MITSKQKNQWNSQAGMTLVELLVVLVVISLIAAIAAPRLLRYVGGAKSSTAETQIENLVSAVELFFLETGRYPTEEEGLSILVSPPSSGAAWNGPYLRKANGITDPWGEPYKYRVPGRFVEFEVYSYG
ncbi:MAG: type II secretion system major pseudopilin GspG, partial [Pseudomonadota bacterium]